MIGHQIIQTSCRRGISGGGSGFQVFSCNESLAELGFLNGSEYQKLFVYDTPVEVGLPSFGYANVDGIGSIFSLNTRLAHDFGGAGTRSGNLLNHSIVVDGLLEFYPAEFFGSPLLRTEMREDEVNSDDPPDYLPVLDLVQAEAINIKTIAEWIEEGDRVEAVERLLNAFIDARADSRMLVILDTPANVMRWVAALEYCLPLKVAREIGFVNYSENAASVRASITGTTRELLDKNTPSYMRASICLFDPALPLEHPLPEGSFIDFVDISYDLNPSALTQFARFIDENVHFPEEFTLETLDYAYTVYSLTKSSVDEWTPYVIRNGLQYALTKGTDELNDRIEDIIEENHSFLAGMDSDTYLEVLEYLIRRWPLWDISRKQFVKEVAVGNVIGILQQEEMDESVFQDYFDTITKACISAGLNIFEILMGDESRSRLFAIAQKLSQPKLKLLALALTNFVLSSNLSVEKLTSQAPLGALYGCLLDCAFAQGSEAGIGLARSVIVAASAKLPYLESLMMTVDRAIRQIYNRNEMSGSREERSNIDTVWDTCIRCIAEEHEEEIQLAAKWLIWAADYDAARYENLTDLYNRIASRCRNTQEACKLFSSFCTEQALKNDAFMTSAYPHLASKFALMLRQFNDEDAAVNARSLLESSLNLQQQLDFIPTLMEFVSETFGIKKTSSDDIRLIDKAVAYEQRTGGIAIVGRAALLYAVQLLDDVSRVSNPIWVIEQLEWLSNSLDLNILDNKAFKEYAKRIGPAIARVGSVAIEIGSSDAIGRTVSAYELSGERLVVVLTIAFEAAMKSFTKRGNPNALLALTTYAAIAADRGVETACIKSISSIKSEDDLHDINRKTTRLLFKRGQAAVNRWHRIVRQARDRRGRGLFGRFRR